jgi:hypothetical protein
LPPLGFRHVNRKDRTCAALRRHRVGELESLSDTFCLVLLIDQLVPHVDALRDDAIRVREGHY